MKIAKLQKVSMIDMPGCITCVVYTQGCNMNCEYCHNKELIPEIGLQKEIPWKLVLNHIKRRQNLLEGIVFSGGEPTIQEDLLFHMMEARQYNMKIGLHTNGSGKAFKEAASFCDYILLSHHNQNKIEIARQAKSLDLSTVKWNQKSNRWENKIIFVK